MSKSKSSAVQSQSSRPDKYIKIRGMETFSFSPTGLKVDFTITSKSMLMSIIAARDYVLENRLEHIVSGREFEDIAHRINAQFNDPVQQLFDARSYILNLVRLYLAEYPEQRIEKVFKSYFKRK